MSKKSENRYFIELFVTFIGLEILLYTIIVYFDIFGIRTEVIKKDPAFMVFYGISAVLFFYIVQKLDKKR